MKNLFALVGMLVIVLGGAGWYLGWYKVNVNKNPDGNLQIQTNVDTQKVSVDSSAFFQKVGQLVSDKASQGGQPSPSAPNTAPANTPGSTNPNATPPGIPTVPSLPTSPPTGSGLNNLLPSIPPVSGRQ